MRASVCVWGGSIPGVGVLPAKVQLVRDCIICQIGIWLHSGSSTAPTGFCCRFLRLPPPPHVVNGVVEEIDIDALIVEFVIGQMVIRVVRVRVRQLPRPFPVTPRPLLVDLLCPTIVPLGGRSRLIGLVGVAAPVAFLAAAALGAARAASDRHRD